ncbi:UbiA prenyltransferase family-domain-containing protein [Dunaliella salina]|uniref:UbiA prenyltransferase family-domain-containing protein n=1 Tax=Dunaliella salina TaxID=3046 RepID=A0ABQ7G661_DUNSA|nr:UbiA prenyltransferase family-domain-containing protein [Dunaliella salina]|eukprot:KAF5830103.1 UbiA prenyltransferase family-domain-containing protein [Dunaliella salina]
MNLQLRTAQAGLLGTAQLHAGHHQSRWRHKNASGAGSSVPAPAMRQLPSLGLLCSPAQLSIRSDPGHRQPHSNYCPPLYAYGAAAGGGGGESKSVKTDEMALPALYRFTRPHTMAGTAISVISISLLALQSHGMAVNLQAALAGLAQALTSALLMNVAIVGVNQLFDIDIDKVNKPYLPLASGEMSVQGATNIIVGCALGGLAIGVAANSPPLLATLVVSLMLGIVYSMELPFMRWKRSPVLAAGCILVVRALAVQLGFFYHMQNAIGSTQLIITPSIIFTVGFMLLFSIVIALFKDVPDAKGDKRAGVRTLTVRLGENRVFWACIWILTLAYMGAVVYSLTAATSIGAAAAGSIGSVAAGGISSIGSFASGATGTTGTAASSIGSVVTALLASLSLSTNGMVGARTIACVVGHIVLAVLLWRKALQVNLESQKDITDCYMFVWKLFYAEYLLIPLLL